MCNLYSFLRKIAQLFQIKVEHFFHFQVRSQWLPMDGNHDIPDSKVHGANMRPTWVLSTPDGPHVGPMNLAIRDGKCHDDTAVPSYNVAIFVQNTPTRHFRAQWWGEISDAFWEFQVWFVKGVAHHSFTALLCWISCYAQPCYNGIPLYHQFTSKCWQ